jgi:hypothetical protein
MTDSLTKQQRRAARLDDPSMERLRNPRARRLLAAGLIAVFVAEAIVIGTASLLPIGAFIGCMVILMIGMVFALGGLKASTRGVEELSPEVLDERQSRFAEPCTRPPTRCCPWSSSSLCC